LLTSSRDLARSDQSPAPSDRDLAAAAQSGDATSLGLLLARHQASLRAVALSILGFGPEADDALQDASVTILRRIGELRDPAAAGPWMRMIVRNTCRMQLRAIHEIPSDEAFFKIPSMDPTPEQVLDHHAMRDWIWHAISQMPEPLQLTLMLRHFSGITSYEQIAAACDVPIGTVRSRLNQARAKMAQALLATTDTAHSDAATLTATRHREGIETLEAAEQGHFSDVVADRWSPDVQLLGGMGERGGRDLLLRAMDRDLNAGIRQRVGRTLASPDITIWENDLINPPEDPDHCPPAVIWMLTTRQNRIHRLRLFFPAPFLRYQGRPVGAHASAPVDQGESSP
jgi:RNA polymerase sigma factor (sigma-70 family)